MNRRIFLGSAGVILAARDLTDWRSDVAIAVGLLERALDAPQEPPASGEQP